MTGAVEKDTNETGNLRPEKNFRKDLERFSRAFADELGWEHETDRKGKTIYAQTNIAPAGGDGSFTLWAPETDLGIYVSVPVAPQSYDNRYGYSNNLKIKDIMGFGEPILWRLRNKEQTFLPNGHNRYAPADITVGELAELAKKELNAYLDNITAAKTLDHILQENQNTRNDERRENSSEKDYPAYGDGSRKDGALGTGILSAEKPVATVSGESGGIGRFDRPRAMRWRQAALERDEDPVVVDEYYYQLLRPCYCPEEPEQIPISEKMMREIIATLKKVEKAKSQKTPRTKTM